MTGAPLIPVRVRGVVVMHTPEQYAALWAGVDREACAGMTSDLDEYLDHEPKENTDVH